MNASNNDLRPATPEQLAEAMEWLEADPGWQRMKFLQAKKKESGLTPEEEKELDTFGRPKFEEGDVIQEFARAIERTKAEDARKAAEG
jgi:uncharacterized protein YnzC (UPF0291/DUF896 family)